ncbi:MULTISPECIES: HGGxSTG domain-containing protein [unclassified Pseudonocardia]|uniref:HGGxSTG domain-containing protein n=1 Tax=unclassified Pseudonocardia TaxID=2619320 RepID=UPI0001FFE7C8|nr:HGGxSTG domain-containing protein [Pseudonocardia sp. Ae707_Ps1]OLM17594.1 hypothetical protein Ae707Ps1_1853 [Pseudonocardia sp. Ae707_Ps1]
MSEQLSASTSIGKPKRVKTKEEFPYGGRGGINPNHAHLTEEQRCQAHKKNGDQCKLPPIRGARVCRQHGGASKHVRRAAKARLENAADRLAKQLLGMATDENLKPETRLAALRDALDRAGLNPRQAMDVTHELKRYEEVFDGIARTRSTVRRRSWTASWPTTSRSSAMGVKPDGRPPRRSRLRAARRRTPSLH